MSTLKLFKKSLNSSNLLSFEQINKISLPLGYFVTVKACTFETMKWLESQEIDYSSTFYENWQTVLSKSREDIWFDQIVSYIGVFLLGEDLRPQDVPSVIPDITKYQVIDVISNEEALSKCDNMLYSGVPLSFDTIEDILNVYSALKTLPNIEKVKNKEAKMFLYRINRTLPIDAIECLRYIVFLATSKTLLIKDKATIAAIKNSNINLDEIVGKFGYDKMATIYHRFHPIFLAFKGDCHKQNNKCVNKLSKLADKFHKPLVAGYWQTVLDNPKAILNIDKEVDKLDNFGKVKLLQAIAVRLKNTDISVYRIRNGKLWLKENTKYTKRNAYNYLFTTIRLSLVRSLTKKATTFYIPTNINLALPTSEKNFVGDYPMGSSIVLSDNNTIIGVNRLKEYAGGYMDFSMVSDKGEKIGWDSMFKTNNNDILFSGDVCIPNKDKQATELFYAKKGFNGRYLLKLNDFSSMGEIPFKFFIAQEHIEKLEKNHMVDPNNIMFKTDMKLEGTELCLGAIDKDKLIFVKLITGSARISGNDATQPLSDYIFDTADTYLDLKEILLEAGYIFTDNNPVLDFRNISKGMILDILT